MDVSEAGESNDAGCCMNLTNSRVRVCVCACVRDSVRACGEGQAIDDGYGV